MKRVFALGTTNEVIYIFFGDTTTEHEKEKENKKKRSRKKRKKEKILLKEKNMKI